MDSYRRDTNNNVPSVVDPYPTNGDHFPAFEDRLPLLGSSRGRRLRGHDLNSPLRSVGYQGRVSNSKKIAGYQGKMTNTKKSAGYPGKLDKSKNSVDYPGVVDNAKSGTGFPAGPIDSQFVGSSNPGFPADPIDSQFVGSSNPDTWGPIVIGDRK